MRSPLMYEALKEKLAAISPELAKELSLLYNRTWVEGFQSGREEELERDEPNDDWAV